jgi:glycosyltransferase involved in cell wall biosynthesis
MEVIVIDNGSSDGSASVIAAAPEVRLLHESTTGAYAARNTGVRAARGEFLAFTDPDCVLAPDWLQQFERMFRDPSVLLACGRRLPARVSRVTRVLAAYETAKDTEVLSGADPQRYYGFTSNLAVRRSTFDAVGPFELLPRGADAILVRRVVDRFGTGAVVFAKQAAVTHLEFTGVASYYRKVLTYGRARARHAAVRSADRTRALTLRERWQILQRCVRTERFSLVDRATVIVLLIGGLVMWEAGALLGQVTARPEPSAS